MHRNPVLAGAVYFALVFAVAAVLGVVRETFLARLITTDLSIVVEAPLLALTAFFVARWTIGRLSVAQGVGARLVMASTALALLLGAEALLSPLLRGEGLIQAWSMYGYLATAANLGALAWFFIAPLWAVRARAPAGRIGSLIAADPLEPGHVIRG
jgi:hypothetical protein